MSDESEDRRAPDDEQPIALAAAEDAGALPEVDRRVPSTPAGDDAFAEQAMQQSMVTVPRSMLEAVDLAMHLAQQDSGYAQTKYLAEARSRLATVLH